jgi:DNA-binding NarL/FixJ family response regulator
MRRNSVLVADADTIRRDRLMAWLGAQDVSAIAASDHDAEGLGRELTPRLVVCRHDPVGISLCHSLRELPEPPMFVVVSDDPATEEHVYFDGRAVVAVVGALVETGALARFIDTALNASARLDVGRKGRRRAKATSHGTRLPEVTVATSRAVH